MKTTNLSAKTVEALKLNLGLTNEIIATLTQSDADEMLNVDTSQVTTQGRKSDNFVKRLEREILKRMGDKSSVSIPAVTVENIIGAENYGDFFSIFINKVQVDSHSVNADGILANVESFRKKKTFVEIKSNKVGKNKQVDACQAKTPTELSRMQALLSIDLWLSRKRSMKNYLFNPESTYFAGRNFEKIYISSGDKNSAQIEFKKS